MTNPKATHPAREAGQRWRAQYRWGNDRYRTDVTWEGTLAARGANGDGWSLHEVIRDGVAEPDSANSGMADRFWDSPDHTMTLLSPAPQTAPSTPSQCGAPDRSGCKLFCGMTGVALGIGTGKDSPALKSWRQHKAYASEPGMVQTKWCSEVCRAAKYPPLPAAPVTTGAKHGCQSKCGKWFYGDSVAFTAGERAGHEANCIDCNPMLQPTQYREPHPPAPQLSSNGLANDSLHPTTPATNDLGTNPKAGPKCGRCGGSLSIRNVPFEQGLLKLCLPCDSNLSEWLAAQFGTPCASPPGLMLRARMGFQPMDDDFAGDAR